MEEEVKFRGSPIFINGREYVVPPLSLRQFRDHVALLTEPIGEISAENAAERMSKFVPVIGLALRRNYPEITDAELLDLLDLGTFVHALRAVQGKAAIKEINSVE